eukprot:gene33977-43922_t
MGSSDCVNFQLNVASKSGVRTSMLMIVESSQKLGFISLPSVPGLREAAGKSKLQDFTNIERLNDPEPRRSPGELRRASSTKTTVSPFLHMI